MSATPEFFSPLVWSAPDFSLRPYNLIFLPGGHEKSVRQLLDSSVIASQLLDYFPLTQKPSGNAIGAVCHGVLALVNAKNAEGKSVIHDCKVTTLPARFEQAAYNSTRLFLGDYYKTYGAGSADVEADVRACLDDDAKQFKGSLSPGA
jgi:putative intracellular protease/amidase